MNTVYSLDGFQPVGPGQDDAVIAEENIDHFAATRPLIGRSDQSTS
ncbi:hypothetical protein U3938_10600 [Escherichia coli]|nr:hypothetical protein [Escherichia coli]WRQ38096.1 hypothetical protein U3938_10600 [Escherichia coli]